MNRRSLTPSPGSPNGVLAQRRAAGGARREISARVTLLSQGRDYDGWALNLSRGGIRVVIEERAELGQEFVVSGWDPDDADAPPRRARVVWAQEEPDGSVLGMEFLDAEPDQRAVPDPAAPSGSSSSSAPPAP